MLNKIWEFIKSKASIIWHVIGGAVTGSILPSLAQTITAGGHLTTAGVVATVVSGVVGAVVGYAQHSNVAGANLVTPDVEKMVDDKITQAVMSIGKKAGMILLMLGLASACFAQEQTGFGINPQFTTPFLFGQDSTGTFVSIPNFGIGADIGWKDFTVSGNDKIVKYSAGFVVMADVAQSQPTGPNSLLNGLVGVEGGYKGINLVFGNQLIGDPLTGPGGSRWLVYVGYDVSALIGNFIQL